MEYKNNLAGKYAITTLNENSIIKKYRSANIKSSEKKMSDTRNYYNILKENNVTMPISSFTVNNNVFELSAEKVKPYQVSEKFSNDCFDQIVNGNNDQKDMITRECLNEVIKVMQSIDSEKPVGYDIAPQNFIYGNIANNNKLKAYAIDIFPPRLAFKNNTKLKNEELLVDYSDISPLKMSTDRELRLKRAYYTKKGMIEQFTTWFIATRFARKNLSSKEIVKLSIPIIYRMSRDLAENNQASMSKHLISYANSTKFIQDLDYRLPRVKKLWKDRMPSTTLCIAAAGKGSRARAGLGGINKLICDIDGKPLLGQLIDNAKSDLNISSVILTVKDKDNDIAKKIKYHCKKNKINLKIVESKHSGVGGAFLDMLKNVNKSENVILSVGDVISIDYTPILDPRYKVVLGASKSKSDKKKRTLYKGQHVLAGIYYLDKDIKNIFLNYLNKAVEKFEIKNPIPNSVNANGEYRVSWIFDNLEKMGCSIGVGKLGEIAEINYAENKKSVEELVKRKKLLEKNISSNLEIKKSNFKPSISCSF